MDGDFEFPTSPNNGAAEEMDMGMGMDMDDLADTNLTLKVDEDKEIGKTGLKKKLLKEGQGWENPTTVMKLKAKRKRIAELSAITCPMENRRKSHWDYVIEVIWLANDFFQERLWKITAAGQISRQIAVSSLVRFQERNCSWQQQMVANNVAKAVMDFWHSVEAHLRSICGCFDLV